MRIDRTLCLDPEPGSDEDYRELVVSFPARREVCARCNGEGHHTNPAIDGNGLTADQLYEDPDFAEDYISGVYDVVCEECRGRNVVDVLDYEAAEREGMTEQLAALRRQEDDLARMRTEEAAERRAGA